MRKSLLLFIFAALATPLLAQSKYGLSCYGDACAAMDQKAEQRMIAAKSACESGDSEVSWRKDSKPSPVAMQQHWQNIHSASFLAERGYVRFIDCAHADLIIRINIDTLFEKVSLEVTDSESGDDVFNESRSIHDEASDLTRMANHFHEAVINARSAVEAAREAQVQAALEQQRRNAVEAAERKCNDEYATIKSWIDNKQSVQPQIDSHNARCSNHISVEQVQQQEKADAAAKQEQALKEKREERLAQSKTNAYAAYTHLLAESPFVAPTAGWAHQAGLGTSNWYIILPGLPSNDCRFGLDGNWPILNCLSGRNPYIPIVDNGRYYLLKGKALSKQGDLSTTVKDGGLTVCFDKAGCHHVLAEVRQVPATLPDKYTVPTPDKTVTTFSNDLLEFSYPQNWKVSETKNKEGVVVNYAVAPPEAHLGTWWTHGFFVGHIAKTGTQFPSTLDGAFEQARSYYEKVHGYTISNVQMVTIGDVQFKTAAYTSPSVLDAGESGYLVITKDHGDGYFWVTMFYPSNDDGRLYNQTFNDILKTFKFKK